MGIEDENNHVIIGRCLRKRISLCQQLTRISSCLNALFWVCIALLSLAGYTNGVVFINRNTWTHSSTSSSSLSPAFTRRGRTPTNNYEYRNNRNSENKMMSTPTTESSNESLMGTSLASSYVIYMMNETRWKLMPLNHPNVSSSPRIGTQALEALISNPKNENDDGSIVLECMVGKDDNDHQNKIVTVQVEHNHRKSPVKDDEDDGLISVLSRILVQSTITKGSIVNTNATTTVSLPDPNGQTITIPLHHKDDYNPYLLFQDLLPSSMKGQTNQKIEMNDLVNQKGQSVGHVPRFLVHQYNLLHSGIGLIIIQRQKQQQDNKDVAFLSTTMEDTSLYVHRRTDTKRIFPSLYDMFVGGVCTAGESLRETAYRELEEELGLSRKEAFSKQPLFSCTCCTSYNRCVVTVYSYQFDQSKDSVRWQPEEVAWGQLVPYSIVEKAAQASIERYQQSSQWPGNLLPDDNYPPQSTIDSSSNDDEKIQEQIPQWDFVPDGLLVWEAWLHWFQKQQQSQLQNL